MQIYMVRKRSAAANKTAASQEMLHLNAARARGVIGYVQSGKRALYGFAGTGKEGGKKSRVEMSARRLGRCMVGCTRGCRGDQERSVWRDMECLRRMLQCEVNAGEREKLCDAEMVLKYDGAPRRK